MPRPRPSLSCELPYHITARCVHKEPFPIPLDEVWEIYENHLFFLHHGFGILIHSFVLMPNHFHMIVRSPQGNLSSAMRYFMKETSVEFVRRSGRVNQNYGQRYHRSLIDSYHYYLHAYKYVYQNPLRAKICASVESYPYSTFQALLGIKKSIIPLVCDTVLFDSEGVEKTLLWLNQMPSKESQELVKKGLKKSTFFIGVERKSRKASKLETELI